MKKKWNSMLTFSSVAVLTAHQWEIFIHFFPSPHSSLFYESRKVFRPNCWPFVVVAIIVLENAMRSWMLIMDCEKKKTWNWHSCERVRDNCWVARKQKENRNFLFLTFAKQKFTHFLMLNCWQCEVWMIVRWSPPFLRLRKYPQTHV